MSFCPENHYHLRKPFGGSLFCIYLVGYFYRSVHICNSRLRSSGSPLAISAPGDMWPRLQTSLIVLSRGGGGGSAHGLCWVEAGDAAPYPTMQDSPHTKRYPVPDVNRDATEKACSRRMKEETVIVALPCCQPAVLGTSQRP